MFSSFHLFHLDLVLRRLEQSRCILVAHIVNSASGVTRGTAPGDTLRGVTPDLKAIFVAEFRKEHWINDVGRWEW